MISTLLDAAKELLHAKISFVPAKKDKKPIGKWKPYQSNHPTEKDAKRWFTGVNDKITGIAVICGDISGGLLCIDFDKPGFLELWKDKIGPLFDRLILQQTGSGNHQVFLRCPNPGKNQKLAKTPDEAEVCGWAVAIETRGEGGYAIVPPSLHPSDNHYEWKIGSFEHVQTFTQEEADRLLDAARSLNQVTDALPEKTEEPKKADLPLREHKVEEPSVIDAFNSRYSITEVLHWFGYSATTDKNRMKRPGGSSGSVWISEGRSYHHSSNDPLNDNHAHDAFDVFCQLEHRGDPKEAAKDAALKLGLPPRTPRPIEGSSPVEPGSPEESNWTESLHWKITESGRMLSSEPLNGIKILANDRRWQGVLGFDEFQHSVIWLKPPPFSAEYSSARPYEDYQRIDDLDIQRTQYWLSEQWHLRLSVEAVAGCLYTAASRNSFHPVRRYLQSLAWDEEKRLDSWLLDYLHVRAEDEDQRRYVQLVGRLWLISAVARVMQPGCKADYVLILEGRQRIGKSTALRILSSPWFTDTPLLLGSKDAFGALRGKWLIELAELDSLIRAESSSAKAFFSSPTDDYRPPYGRHNIQAPRQCVFAGSVNQKEYLKDPTGGSRYWPVWCESVDLEALAQDRDQLWAEALHEYQEGKRWWPSAEEHAWCKEEQIQRLDADPWQRSVAEYVEGRLITTTEDILESAILLSPKDQNRSHSTRVGIIMASLGWTAQRKMVNRKRQTFYEAPPKDCQPTLESQPIANPEKQVGTQKLFPYGKLQ